MIKEQIIEDLASGLTLQFEARDDGTCNLKIYGNLPFGNRDFLFEPSGELGATGTATAGLCRPSWLKEVTA